jgi:hyperosmotically inducible protein
VLTAVALALAPAGATAQTKTSPAADDSTVKSQVETRLKANATLKDDSIDVAVDNGVVTLSGKVDSRAEVIRAAQLAKIAGVTKVENKLEIDTDDRATGTAGKTADKIGDKTEKAADRVVDETKKAGKATKNAAGEVGEAVTDAWITTRVKADYVNEDTLKGSSIDVDTNNHVVTLKGTVTSAAGRARAVEIAKATKGVSRVVDNLTIAPPK